MHESTLAKRYAGALADLAATEERLEAVGAELNRFLAVLDATPAFGLLLTNPTSEQQAQHAVLATFLTNAKVGGITANFLKLLVDKRRMVLIAEMVSAYNRDVEQRSGRIRADVRTAKPLSGAHAEQLQALLSAKAGKEVRLQVTTDPGLLGGLVVTIGSTMMDFSVRSHLNRMQAIMRG